MPFQPILPTWLAWNNANFTSPTGITDLRTQQMFGAGGLNFGDYFDATEQEANACSALNIGLLHSGRYRLVQVDSGATAANVKTGTVGYCRIGTFVQNVVVATPGSGGTPGTYNVAVPPGLGGGSGAVLQVVVGASGAITNAIVLQGGFGFSGPLSAMTFTPTGLPGLTGETLLLQLNSTPNVVTSADQANAQFGGLPPRAVVFLNSILPGNYGFVQELGVASVIANAAVTPPAVLNGVAATGLVTPVPSAVTAVSIGQAVDTTSAANQMCKMYMQYVPICQD